MSFRSILTVFFSVTFLFTVMINGALAQNKADSKMQDYSGNKIFSIQYEGLPILLYLPSEKEMAAKGRFSYINLALNYTDKNNDIEISEKINAIFNLPLDDFSKYYQIKGVADIYLHFDNVTLPLRLNAILYPPKRGKNADKYIRYELQNLENNAQYFELNELNLNTMKSLSTFSFEVTNSIVPSFNSNGRISLSQQKLSDYFRAPDERKQAANKAKNLTTSKRAANVKAYRENNLYSGFSSIKPAVMDDVNDIMPTHQMLDTVCYEASFPFAVESEIVKTNARKAKIPPIDLSKNYRIKSYQKAIDNATTAEQKAIYQKKIDAIVKSEEVLRKAIDPQSKKERKQVYQSVQLNLANRCMSADKISQQKFKQCTKSQIGNDNMCQCVKEQLFDFWSKNAKSETPIQYRSSSSGQQYNFAIQACRARNQ